MLASRIGGRDRCHRYQSRLGQPLDERLSHVACPEEGDPFALDAHAPPSVTAGRAARGPKIAVPTRTMVAPSSMATPKSPLMPMEQCSSFATSRRSLSRLVQ